MRERKPDVLGRCHRAGVENYMQNAGNQTRVLQFCGRACDPYVTTARNRELNISVLSDFSEQKQMSVQRVGFSTIPGNVLVVPFALVAFCLAPEAEIAFKELH